jgi:hypothetical protein
MIQNLTTDPILEEIHRVRREMSDRFGGDFVAMLNDARRRQEASGRPIWKPKHDEFSVEPERPIERESNR